MCYTLGMERKPMSVYLDPELDGLVREYAKEERRSLSEAINFIVGKFFEQKGSK